MGTKGNVAVQGSCARGSRTPGLSLKKKQKKKTKGDNGGVGGRGRRSSEQFQENSCAGCRKK